MPGAAREEILAGIRAALGRKVQGQSDEAAIGARTASGDGDSSRSVEAILGMAKQRRPRLIKQFDSELTRIGGKVHYARSASEVGDLLLHLAEELRARNLVVWEDRNLPDAEYLRSFDAAGLKVHFEDREGDPESFLRKAAQADIGITSVDYALADTATLVLISGEGRARSVSLLPPVHVAILDTEKILPGLDELFGLLGGHPPGSAVTFITGPSRTADIELTLVVGVHGPQELHVVLLEK